MKVSNMGKRAFIVKEDSIIKGGEKLKTGDYAINPGDTAEVTDECGELLSTYSDIKILDGGKKKKTGGKTNGVDSSGK